MEAHGIIIFDTHIYMLKGLAAFAYEQRHDMQLDRFPLRL